MPTPRPAATRRTVLASLGAMALAGCTTSGSSDSTTTDTPTSGDPDIGTFDDPENWVAESGRVGTQSTDPYVGSHSIRLTCEHTDNRVRARYDFPEAIDLSDYHLTYAFKFAAGTRGANFQVQIHAPDGKNYLQFNTRAKPGDGWIRDGLSTPGKVVGYPNMHFVRAISFTQYTGGGATEDISIDDLQLVSRPAKPTIVFTFDDGVRSTYEKAVPILEEFGYAGSIAVIPGRETRPEFITIEEMHELQDRGWDIMSHPQVPERLPELPVQRQLELIRDGKRWLIDNGFESGSRFLVYPYSGWDRETKELVDQYHELAFAGPGTTTWVPPEPIVTPRIRADDPDLVSDYIDRLLRYNGVMVLVNHSIDEEWITEEKFRTIVEHVHEVPVSVMTVGEWYESSTGQ